VSSFRGEHYNSDGKAILLRYENSSELPTSIITAIKELDSAVGQNAGNLQKVLNNALKENPDYYLHYDDDKSPYFHQLDVLIGDNSVPLSSDKIRDAIRQFLGVK
jgi:hypothetical protein